MSFDPDNPDNERSVSQQNEEIIILLKAILLGIELISDSEDLINQVRG